MLALIGQPVGVSSLRKWKAAEQFRSADGTLLMGVYNK